MSTLINTEENFSREVHLDSTVGKTEQLPNTRQSSIADMSIINRQSTGRAIRLGPNIAGWGGSRQQTDRLDESSPSVGDGLREVTNIGIGTKIELVQNSGLYSEKLALTQITEDLVQQYERAQKQSSQIYDESSMSITKLGPVMLKDVSGTSLYKNDDAYRMATRFHSSASNEEILN